MYSEDKVLFKKALMEAVSNKFENELGQCYEDASFSKRHEKAMRRILSTSGKPSFGNIKKAQSKKRLIAALVAALILLIGGLTVYAKRDAVIRFVEQIFEKFSRVSYQEEQDDETAIPDTIEKEFIPAYIPEGFELQEYDSSLNSVQIKWQSSNGQFIWFEQSIIGEVYDYDNDHSSFEKRTAGDYNIYVVHYESIIIYLWSDGKYSYSINCSPELPFETISQMILSVKVKE